MRDPKLYERIAFLFATSGLVLLSWTVLAAASGAAPARAYGPLAVPDIKGIYDGPGNVTDVCADGTINFTVPGTLIIPSQQGQSFSGSLDDGEFILSGSVDTSGGLAGTYTINLPVFTGGGTFIGGANGDQIQLTLTGTLVSPAGAACGQTYILNATRSSSTGTMADLSISGSASQSPVASGTRITYTLTVTNAGPDDATNVLVTEATPAGTTFAAATQSQGQLQDPGPGGQGNVVYSLGTMAKGATATLTFIANVLAPGGSTLVNSPFVTSSVSDPNLVNNSTTISTPVLGGAIVKLAWNQPSPTAANPTPAPSNLRVLPGGPSTAVLESQFIMPQDSCTLISINIYKSDQANVQPIPINLWLAVAPANLQATLAAAPGGSFYAITNVWKCGDTLIESGVSNEAGVPAGPTITGLRVGGKLKALGSGFSDGVQVLVDGVGFVKATLLADNTLVIQKGPLTDGTSIGDVGTTKAVLVTIKNGDGGLGSFTFRRP